MFDASGTFRFSFGGGFLSSPTGLDFAANDTLYVSSSGTLQVVLFDISGQEQASFGAANLRSPQVCPRLGPGMYTASAE